MRARPPVARVTADLHVHTTHSDGACSPGEVVRTAFDRGLAALAITDHDTVSAIEVARPEAIRLGIELIGGIEITAEREGREVHILGHFINEFHPELLRVSAELRSARKVRIELMVENLQELGLRVDLTALRNAFPRATIGRKHLADWLVRTGQVKSNRDAFALYLGENGPAQVPKPRLPWMKAIELVRQAGGIAGLAHPPFDLREVTLREYADGGLGSIEVAGPGINAKLGPRWRSWADAMGLVPTAGSDFHSNDRLGRWLGSVTMPIEDVERLRAKAGSG